MLRVLDFLFLVINITKFVKTLLLKFYNIHNVYHSLLEAIPYT